MPDDARDPELGISIRFIKEYNIAADTSPRRDDWFYVRRYSCQILGHTFVINVGEKTCNVCGAKNPDA